MTAVNQSDSAAVISAVKSMQAAANVTITRGTEKEAMAVAIPSDMKLVSIKSTLDEYLQKPERHKGFSTHTTLNSIIRHANTFKTEGRSAVFASEADASLLAVYDYPTHDVTSFREHGALFSASYSRQWKVWTEASGEGMSQMEFANFIEENALDLINPPATTSTDGGDDGILTIARTLGTTIASASKILELARGVNINEDAKAKSHFDPGSGQVQIEYLTQHMDGAGQKLVVPGLFLVAIPVYEGEHSYRIVVRLRYRLSNGTVRWFVNLYQPEKCVEDAFGEICANMETATGLPVYRGKAE